ncbi:MAG: hypothetical protein ACK5KR_00720 [Breznakia sp.]
MATLDKTKTQNISYEEALHRVGLDCRVDQKVYELSGGYPSANQYKKLFNKHMLSI